MAVRKGGSGQRTVHALYPSPSVSLGHLSTLTLTGAVSSLWVIALTLLTHPSYDSICPCILYKVLIASHRLKGSVFLCFHYILEPSPMPEIE